MAIAVAMFCMAVRVGAADGKVDYARQIRPILADNCFACHGPDAKQRQAGLRLDVREEALRTLESGDTAIVPGKLTASTLVKRIMSSDGDERMPPADPDAWVSRSSSRRTRRSSTVSRSAPGSASVGLVMLSQPLLAAAITTSVPAMASFFPAVSARKVAG